MKRRANEDEMLPTNPTPNTDGKVTLRIPSGTPLFTYSLLFMLLVVALVHFTATPDTDTVLAQMGLQGEAVLDRLQYYRMVTALLLLPTPAAGGIAAGLLGAAGVLLGLYTLYTVSLEMEQLWGTPRTILVYTLGGAFGAALTLMLVPLGLLDPTFYLSAAMGGILALIGAQMVYLFKTRRLYRAMAPRRQAFLLVIGLLNLIVSAFATYTDFIGALGALLAGGVLAAFISPFMLPRQHPDDPNALLAEDVNPLRGRVPHIAGFLTVVMLLVALAVNLPR